MILSECDESRSGCCSDGVVDCRGQVVPLHFDSQEGLVELRPVGWKYRPISVEIEPSGDDVQDLHGTDGIDATDSAHLLCLCLHGCVAS